MENILDKLNLFVSYGLVGVTLGVGAGMVLLCGCKNILVQVLYCVALIDSISVIYRNIRDKRE